MTRKPKGPLPTIGWREWVALPELDVERIKVKVDTGARSSSLHAYDMKRFRRKGVSMIRFKVHPIQRDAKTFVEAEAEVADVRTVKSSNGAITVRPVIETRVRLGDVLVPIELTLVRRDMMGFRMLLGRQAVRARYLVDAGSSFLLGR